MAHKYLLMFRAVLVETLLLQSLYSREVSLDHPLVWILLACYAGLAVFLYWLAVKGRLSQQWGLVSFIGDILMTGLILYSSGILERDFYLAYFLVILATCLLEDPRLSFVVGGVACVVYGAMAFPGWERFDPSYLLRLSLLLATSFFSTYVIDRARSLQRATAEFYEARIASMQRLTLFGQALAGVLHEVKTPLGTIALTADYLRDLLKRGQAEEAARRLDVIEGEAERAAAIISEQLDLARPSDLALDSLDLREPLGKALELMKPRLEERDIGVSASLVGEARALGSRRHLIQVFTILLMNASEAMPLGGSLTVTLAREGGRLRLTMRDTGAGFEPETAAKLFQPFSTHKEGGTGLGLSIARWIIEKHAGAITLSSPGRLRGAEVLIDLPAA